MGRKERKSTQQRIAEGSIDSWDRLDCPKEGTNAWVQKKMQSLLAWKDFYGQGKLSDGFEAVRSEIKEFRKKFGHKMSKELREM